LPLAHRKKGGGRGGKGRRIRRSLSRGTSGERKEEKRKKGGERNRPRYQDVFKKHSEFTGEKKEGRGED